ncbi:Cof-type HAD-IIB family hydrolase [Aureimonas jatrophae]|jgi:Cof subfamily protein (haloacid dehalogenase superfamily)|uniref:Cof subfamily of IIB subfamily of haloacid dehalogenase superfamily/HAD-superfamily hydrolase, subfamily IIB n=1 Tax=Aureimonas jatrophae TaxID=1166073 RepID=A0A1H0EPE4_9HYPH|nr:Cof-type HAD-IIB family hydrolase [Aureimonas jatrophae]MBB3950391.1 hypothetical protein [Aureimonas jatrophae]SDN84221.1 hypothetical protein SAMN05192530_102145 [Aureimonas jatrophae]
MTPEPRRPEPSREELAAVRLVVSDIDGTLVRDDKSLSEATLRAVRRAEAAGILFTLISARPASGLGELVERLGIETAVGAFNGGTLFRPGGEVIEAHRLDEAAARRTVEMLDEAGVPVWLFADGRWLTRGQPTPYDDRERRAARLDPSVVPDFAPFLARADKVVGVSERFDLVAGLEASVGAALGAAANVIRSQHYFLDVTAPAANKGDGVSFLARAAGVDLAHTAAIGDMANDVPMLRRAGIGVAMGQAPDAVRAAARLVTTTNQDDGVARFLDRLVEARG